MEQWRQQRCKIRRRPPPRRGHNPPEDAHQSSAFAFKAHWGKINFFDPEFVRRHHGFDALRPLISPMFMNDYLDERIGPV
jgi:hypothetical protein